MQIKETLKKMFQNKIYGVSFLPTSIDGNVDLKGFEFNKKSKFETHENLGNRFHIILYKWGEFGSIIHADNFEAFLTGPEVYIHNLIKSGFFGIVVKKTKGKFSTKFVNDLFQKLIVYS